MVVSEAVVCSQHLIEVPISLVNAVWPLPVPMEIRVRSLIEKGIKMEEARDQSTIDNWQSAMFLGRGY